MRFRKFGLAFVLVLVAAFALTASTAFADDIPDPADAAALPSHDGPKGETNPDPQTANIPYLGWLGNQIKVAKCLNWRDEMTPADISAAEASLGVSISFPGRFSVEDWSGVNEQFAGPVWHNGDGAGDRSTTVPVEITDRGICWTAHVSSNKPGLAVIKLAVSAEVLSSIKFRFGNLISTDGGVSLDNIALYREVLLKHQFLTIWMQSKAPVIKEISDKEPGGNLENGQPVADPAGDGVFGSVGTGSMYDLTNVDDNDLEGLFGVVKATVKGTFPMGNDFAGMFTGNLVTLPDQWGDLAKKLAVDDTSALGGAPGSAYMRWDIHDNNTPHSLTGSSDPFHSKDASCNTGTAKGIDAVDNCWRGAETGPFSRVNGATWWTVGPFDPLFPDQTLLNDGVLDPWDAPMPPIRMDFGLSAGSIGAFETADKADVYDSDNTKDTRHDLYAPFYEAYIPAAGLGGREAGSGVAGSFANNYPGFISDGKYDFWNTYAQAEQSGNNTCKDPQGDPYEIPTGDRQVSVYTDEHGEAFVKFMPYVGLYLSPDAEYNCNVKPGLYGEADIQATAHYPDQQPLWDGPKKSNVLRKVAYQRADKKLECVKKPNTSIQAFCVETVTDFNGDPIEGVRVRFNTSGDQAVVDELATDLIPPYNTLGQGETADDPARHWVELTTNAKGQAGVVVTSSLGCVDVTASNEDTEWDNYDKSGYTGSPVILSQKVDTGLGVVAGCNAASENPTAQVGIGLTPVVAPTTPPAGGGTQGGGGTQSGGGGAPAPQSTTSTVVSLGGPIIQATPVLSATQTAVVAQASARLFSVKVLQTKVGRYLVVNVKGKAKMAKIRIQIMGKNGKVLKTLVRTVPTNRSFKIADYKLAKTALSVKATVSA